MSTAFHLEIGHTRMGTELRWENLPNGSMTIAGQSGCGKTSFLVHCAAQIPAQNGHGFIFDYAGDIADKLAQSRCEYERLDVIRDVKLHPFRPMLLGKTQDDACYETPYDTAVRVCEAILRAYGSRTSMQRIALINATTEFISKNGTAVGLQELLDYINSDRSLQRSLTTVRECLQNICHVLPDNGRDFSWDISTPGITAFSFARLPNEASQSVMTQFLLFDLWSQVLEGNQDHGPVIAVLEECQRFKFNDQSILTKILREGRKYAFYGWFASQFLDQASERVLNQAAMRAHFFPGEDNVEALAKRLHNDVISTQECKRRIRSLRTGEFILMQNGRIIINRVPDPGAKENAKQE